MDAVHPQHNPVLGCGWIKRGKQQAIQSNTGRQRLNINGAINIETLELTYRIDNTINAVSTIALLKQLESAYPAASRIIVICDNARYYKSKLVAEYLKNSRIQLEPLPAYSPNLNLIERFWKFFKKQVLYNRYYERFAEFRIACKEFLRSWISMRPNCARCLLRTSRLSVIENRNPAFARYNSTLIWALPKLLLVQFRHPHRREYRPR
ncbi:hypothetical protein ThidrDRAFT_0099 [Thiorhodococcus drewsii AZ1]|uniref:Tc1-like transposase DDE domain-containing protein n=2 Tax=Thiorhodococcus drewsii TaxID=210408 RepID=G2DW38_9GAMM|nr:hypothetical protein ThidrDRAFT_0099 [Thiorhodococcus drewsii AZ1]